MSNIRATYAQKSKVNPTHTTRKNTGTDVYSMMDAENKIGFYASNEMASMYSYNIASGCISEEVSNLKKDDWRQVMIGTYRVLSEDIQHLKQYSNRGREFENQGASVLTNIVKGADIYTLSVGNCESFLVILSPDKEPRIKKINQPPHTTSSQTELERLKKIPGVKIENDRVYQNNISMEVTREFGDSGLSAISHDPDFFTTHVKLEKGETAFLISATEGLAAFNQLNETDIANIVALNISKSANDIASILCRSVYGSKVPDNTTVAVTPINPLDNSPRYLALAKGHFENTVARYFVDHLNDTLNLSLTMQHQPETSFFNVELERRIETLNIEIKRFREDNLLFEYNDEVLISKLNRMIELAESLIYQANNPVLYDVPRLRIEYTEEINRCLNLFILIREWYGLQKSFTPAQILQLRFDTIEVTEGAEKLLNELAPVQASDKSSVPIQLEEVLAPQEEVVIDIPQANDLPTNESKPSTRTPEEEKLIDAMAKLLNTLASQLDTEIKLGRKSRWYELFHDFNKTKPDKLNAVRAMADDCDNSDITLAQLKENARVYLTKPQVAFTTWPLKSRTAELLDKIVNAEDHAEYWNQQVGSKRSNRI